MRIIAGSHKGARIFAPKGRETRPTGDRVREAAFNLLGPGAAEEPDLPLPKRTSRRYGAARLTLFGHE